MFIIFTLTLIISTILIIINSFIAKKTKLDREKTSPFECGFDPKSMSRLPFSLRFYLISLIFLIFDIEITLILPSPILMKINDIPWLSLALSVFIIILILGLLHEWNQGSLNWDN